jgi:hypothetical protein
MKTSMKAWGTALAVVAVGLALAGCGSDTKSATTSSSSSTSASSSSKSSKTSESKSSSSEPAAPAGANETIADYIKEAGATETPVKRGDPGTPNVNLPVLAGWEDVSGQVPGGFWGGFKFSDPAMASDPPTILAVMSKLTGPVDGAKILEYAPGELKNLPGFDSMGGNGEATKLSGFDAFQFGGTYVKGGAKRVIAQKTVVIPSRDGDGIFVLQLNADGTEDQMTPLVDATSQIDEKTTITP